MALFCLDAMEEEIPSDSRYALADKSPEVQEKIGLLILVWVSLMSVTAVASTIDQFQTVSVILFISLASLYPIVRWSSVNVL